MKLRSGKVVHYKKLPQVLEVYIDKGVQAIDTLVPANKKAAGELLTIIGNAYGICCRHDISSKVSEIFNNDRENIASKYSLSAVAGSLLMLVVGNSAFYEANDIQPYEYHDLIQEKILNAVTVLGDGDIEGMN